MHYNDKMDIKKSITEEIKRFVVAENAKCRMSSCKGDDTSVRNLWQEPIVGFAAAESEYIDSLKQIVHPDHQMPKDVLPGAKTVIAYFVPFSKWVAKSNSEAGADAGADHGDAANLASPQWAESYELTNAMFARLNEHIIQVIRDSGHEAATAPEAQVFYRDEVISHWSFRHLAYAAGLGTFGLNNMLITDKGCSGRFNTVITDIDVEPDQPKEAEACLFKKNGTCGACMVKCPAGAISEKGFDRHKCYEQCLKNAAIYTEFGSSYAGKQEEGATGADAQNPEQVIGSEVCGKCIAGMPCAYR